MRARFLLRCAASFSLCLPSDNKKCIARASSIVALITDEYSHKRSRREEEKRRKQKKKLLHRCTAFPFPGTDSVPGGAVGSFAPLPPPLGDVRPLSGIEWKGRAQTYKHLYKHQMKVHNNNMTSMGRDVVISSGAQSKYALFVCLLRRRYADGVPLLSHETGCRKALSTSWVEHIPMGSATHSRWRIDVTPALPLRK